MIKKPKTNIDLSVSKSPKISASPAQYKDWPVSWQISHIDNGSKWGFSVFRNYYKFRFHESLLSKLPDDIDSHIYDSLNEFNGKEFSSIDDFLASLHAKCGNLLTAEIQRFIVSSFEENIFWTEIYSKLRHFETTLWQELEKEQFGGENRKTKHHSVSISKIIPLAQERLSILRFDDIDELFSFRLAGTLRIWGIRERSYFRILWFDLAHEICPSNRN